MANNEIKVTIKADNKPFTESLKQCTAELKKFQQATDSMKIDTNNLAKAETAMKSLSDAMKAIKGGQTVTVGADVSQALSAIHEVENAAKSAQDAKVNVSVDKAQAISDIENIQQALTKISSSLSNISVDNGQALRAAEETQRAIDGIHDEKVNVEMKNTDALAALKQLSEALKGLKSAKITVNADSKEAEAELKKVTVAVQNMKKYLKAITVKVNTRQALQNITKLISAARKLRQELKQVKLPSGGGGELEAKLKRIEALNRQVLSTMKDISAESRKMSTGMSGAGKSSESMLSKLGNLSLVASGAVQAFTMIKDLAGSIVMPGFNFTKEMEMNQLGIAGILQSMTLLNGQAVKFDDAMAISSEMMNQLRRDAIMTSASTEELVTTFRALLAPGIGAGMSLDEIREFTTVGVNAVKSIGLNSTQFVQELRDLVQGGIQASSSTLATSLGLTDKDIKEAKASSEGLFRFLMERVAGFKDVQFHFPDTLEGQMSRLKEVSTAASAKITEAFKEDFKEIVSGLADLMGDVDEKTGKITINPAIIEVIDDIKEVWKDLQYMIEDTIPKDGELYNNLVEIVKSLYHATIDVTEGFMDFFRVMGNSTLVKGFTEILRDAAKGLELLTEQFRIFYDERAKSLGVKKERQSSEWAHAFAVDYVANMKTVDTSNVTSKHESAAQKEAAEKAEKERIKLAQKALKEMVAYWKVELDRVTRAIDDQLNQNQAKYDQGYTGVDEYYLTKVNLDMQKTRAELDNLEKELAATKNLPVDPKNEFDQQAKIDKLTGEIEKLTDQLAKQQRTSDDLGKAMEKVNRTTDVKALIHGNEQMYGLSQQVSTKTGVPAQWIYAQWAHESNDFTSQLARENNNFGGLTQEKNNGDENKQPDGGNYYMKFASPEEYADYFARYLKKYYPEATKAKTPEAYAMALKDGGYYGASYEEYIGGMNARMSRIEAVQPIAGEGTTWHKIEAENPKYDALENKAKQALELVAAYTYKLTGQSLGLTSGKRSADLGYSANEIGGHGSGVKFDAINNALYDEEIRKQVIAYAESIGLKVLDEIKDPTAKATGQHLDFDASKFDEQVSETIAAKAKRMLEDTGIMVDKDSAAWKTAHGELSSKVIEIMRKFSEDMGDVATVQLVQIEKEYNKTIELLENNKMPEVANMARSILGREKSRIKFTQLQKDLEYAQDELIDTQEELYYELESGTKTSTQITEEYLAKCKELFGGKLTELQAQLSEAIRTGDRDMARDIKNKIKEVITTIGDGIKAILDKIDAEANREIEKIQMNKHLTKMQKDDAIDAVRQGANEKKIKSLEIDSQRWKAMRPNMNQDALDAFKKEKGDTIDQAILKAEKEIEYLNYQLEQTPTLLDKVQIAGKQAFEDGLLDFLTRGINECENLGDAVQDLARTVLEAIQRMYAEALVKNIMGALFPVAGANIPSSGNSRPNGILGPLRPDGSFAEGGAVRGPGTGTSDSILAALSNGEFVINAEAVKQIGTDTLHRINSGQAFQLPLPKFAMGGLIGDEGGIQKEIPQFAADAVKFGMGNFGVDIGTSFSPTFNNNTVVRIDGNGMAEHFKGLIMATINSNIDKILAGKARLIQRLNGMSGRG